jgi:hypothetical protein
MRQLYQVTTQSHYDYGSTQESKQEETFVLVKGGRPIEAVIEAFKQARPDVENHARHDIIGVKLVISGDVYVEKGIHT